MTSYTHSLVCDVISHGNYSTKSADSARRLLNHFGTAQGLALASQEEIKNVGKLTDIQAKTLHRALELGREACSEPLRSGERLSSSRDLYHRYKARFFSVRREYFFALLLNSKNELIREVDISIGSLNVSVVHPREVFSFAVRDSASAVVLLHNHPSGDPAPSNEDRDCTARLVNAGKILGIRVLDHIVIGHNEYYSFADAGQMESSI